MGFNSGFKGLKIKKMGLIVCPEMSVRNRHYSLCNNPEERSSHLLHGRNLQSCKVHGRICRRQECKWGLHKEAVKWPLPVPAVWYCEHHSAWQVYLVLGTRGLNKSPCFLLFFANASCSGTVTILLVPGHRLWRWWCGLLGECSYHSDKEMQHGNCVTLRRLMSYIYGAPILDVSRSRTTTQHSR